LTTADFFSLLAYGMYCYQRRIHMKAYICVFLLFVGLSVYSSVHASRHEKVMQCGMECKSHASHSPSTHVCFGKGRKYNCLCSMNW